MYNCIDDNDGGQEDMMNRDMRPTQFIKDVEARSRHVEEEKESARMENRSLGQQLLEDVSSDHFKYDTMSHSNHSHGSAKKS